METITNLTPQDFLNLYQSLIQYVGLDWVYAAAILSLLIMAGRTLWLRHKAGAESFLNSERVMNILVVIAAYGDAAFDFFLHTPNANPGWLFLQGMMQRGLMQNLYVHVFKPYVPKLWAGFKQWVNNRRISIEAGKMLYLAREAEKAAKAAPVPVPESIRAASASGYHPATPLADETTRIQL